MFINEIIDKKNLENTLNGKVSKKKEIPEILGNVVEETPKYFPEEGERVIYNPYGRFTSPDDKLCEIIEKKFKKGETYYKLELIEKKRTKSAGVPEIEWPSGVIYEDVLEKNIISLPELISY